MPRKCVFYNCTNNNFRSLYRFPTNDQKRLKLWLTNAGNRILENLTLLELRNRYLCEDHFNDHFVFKKEGKRNRLKRNAVPYHHADVVIVSQTDTHTPVPSLPTEDAAMEASEDTEEDSKCDYIVHQLLCMACLGSGQTLHILRDEALKLYKLAVNDGRQLVHNVAPRVCWQCEVLLKRVLQFRERVTECHHTLYSARVTRCDVTRAPRLRVHRTAAVDIPPLAECDVSQVDPETETDVDIKQETETDVDIKQETETDAYTIPEIEIDVHIKRETETDEYINVYIKQEMETDVYIKQEKETDVYIKQEKETDVYIKQEKETDVYIKQEKETDVYIKQEKETDVYIKQEKETDVYIKQEKETDVYIKQEKETDVYIKQEKETDVYIKQEKETDVYIKLEATETESSPCPACLCAGRRMISIRDKELHYYRDILTQNRVESGVSSPRLCWECCSVLLRATRFSEQASESYRTLLPSLQHADVQDISTLLCAEMSLPPRLSRCVRECVDIPPHAHTHTPPTAHVQRRVVPASSSNITCDRCQTEFAGRRQLVRHLAGNIYPHNTRACVESALEHPRRRKQGAALTSRTTEQYQCTHCSKMFTQKGTLNVHMRTHTGEKPYQCSQCSKTFNQKSNLNLHMGTHPGETPYQCSQCSKGFTVKRNLDRHMRTHTGEKPYQCSQCTKKFALKGNLVVHMRIHTGVKPYQCSQCSKTFIQQYNLKLHMRTHTGQTPYHCSQCSQGFTVKRSLDRHMRTHTGEKPYQCSYCSKTYSAKRSFNAHIRIHLGEETLSE